MASSDGHRTGPGLALGAAALFGLSAPAAKLLAGAVDPWLLAGLLYLGSGIGLGLYHLTGRLLAKAPREARLGRHDLPWLAGAIVIGGVIGPVLLMYGLALGTAVQSSLLLNLEGVFTALVAWSVFREHFDARIAIGMASIALGAVILAWNPSEAFALEGSALLVSAAGLAWAIDNNLTRMVAGGDPVQIAALKGLTAGSINILLATGQQAAWPGPKVMISAGVVGFLGYGTSLVLFVLALRLLGSARAYFSTAPFMGAIAAAVALREPLGGRSLLAAVLMGIGVWLHLTERHHHEHQHEALEHTHAHVHDEHHQHAHPPGTPTGEPHSHAHVHEPLRHSHPHFPDLHHRHHH
jgi:drug/metabolite transporter (DMT)-like permease